MRFRSGSLTLAPEDVPEHLPPAELDGMLHEPLWADSAEERDEDEVKQDVGEEEGTGDFFGSVTTLANSAIGAGVLAFPYAFKGTGVGFGVVLTVGLGLLMGFALRVICESCDKHRHCKSYNTLVRTYFGKSIGASFEVVVILYLFGSCVGYLIILYDMVQPVADFIFPKDIAFYDVVIKENALSSRGILIGIFTFPIVLPLCLLRTISALKFSSALAVFAVVYMSCLVSVKAAIQIHNTGTGPDVQWFFNDAVGLATAIPLLCFAFQCQVNVPPIYAEMKKEIRTTEKFNKVAMGAYAICFCLYVPCGIGGYLFFGAFTPSDILKSNDLKPGQLPDGFDKDDVAVLIGRLCIMCAVMCCYPLNHYPARPALYSLIFSSDKEETKYRPRASSTTPELSAAATKVAEIFLHRDGDLCRAHLHPGPLHKGPLLCDGYHRIDLCHHRDLHHTIAVSATR